MTAPQDEAPSSRGDGIVVGLHGAGHMGSGLGWALRQSGARVITTVAGRSERTARLVAACGLEVVQDLDDVVRQASHILVVTPPGAAIDAAASLAAAATRTGARPLVADMNAVAPATVAEIADTLGPLELVDGSISGPPPTVRPGARLYFSGPRSADFTDLPWRHVSPIRIDDRLGSASAVKMSTASVYKGLIGLATQAIRAAAHYGVLEQALADLRESGHDLTSPVALAATKAYRYVPEMREIAKAQAGAGLTPDLFVAFAEVYAQVATTELAGGSPESADLTLSPQEIAARLGR